MKARITIAAAAAAAAAGALALAAHGAHAATEYVDALVWNTARPEAPKLFPEQLPGAPAPEGWAAKPSFGVAFSGGGTRAATATLGQLRALVKLGWYSQLRYISSISGGTWGSLPFTYLPDAIDDKDYLGPLIPPKDLLDKHFAAPPKQSLAWAIRHASLDQDLVHGWLTGQGDESYAQAVSGTFLRPFGLEDMHRGFAWSAEHARQIAARNALCHDRPAQDAVSAAPRRPCGPGEQPSAALRPQDFFLPRAGRPFHIVNASFLAERAYGHVMLWSDSKFPLQVTPYYAGVPKGRLYSFKGLPPGTPSQLQVGGSLVESFAFDTWPPLPVRTQEAPDSPTVLYRAGRHRLRDRFTLRDALAVSSAAPQQTTSALGFRNLGFPEFHHWGMGERDAVVQRPLLHEHAHGDGGHVDNIGLGALLERGVRNIIVFANMPYSFNPPDFRLGPWSQGRPVVVDSLAAYFDPPLTEEEKRREGNKREVLMDGMNYLIKQVAPGREVHCTADRDTPDCARQDLLRAFMVKQMDGQPLVHCQAYLVNSDNKRFRVPASPEPVHICWAYLDRGGSWAWLNALNNLSPSLRADLQQQKNDFEHFPNYWTVLEGRHFKGVARLNPRQITAMSQLTSWTVCASATQIAREFSELKLPLQGCPGIGPGP